MYPLLNDDNQWHRSIPRWALLYVLAPSFLLCIVSIVCALFLRSHPILFELFTSLGFLGFGISLVVIVVQGIRMGFLPGRALVSIKSNSGQFWLTIIFLSCFVSGALALGTFGAFCSISKLLQI